MDQVSGTAVEKGNAVIQLTASPNKGGRGSQFKRIVGREKLDMNHLIHMINAPALSDSCAARIGRQLVVIGFGLKAAHGLVAVILGILLGVASVSAQTPSGQFFNGDSAQLGNSLRSVTFFLAAAMIIAGIIFIAVGIITSGLRESLSTWKFITGAACFAFGGVCAAIYAFSQGETVPVDNQF
jgi:hypothetical protein